MRCVVLHDVLTLRFLRRALIPRYDVLIPTYVVLIPTYDVLIPRVDLPIPELSIHNNLPGSHLLPNFYRFPSQIIKEIGQKCAKSSGFRGKSVLFAVF